MNFTKTILFFPGFLREPDDFEFTEKGKKIGIISFINKRANVYKVNISNDDYLKPIDKFCEEIMETIKKYKDTKLFLVGHSFGSFYVLKFIELFGSFIKGFLLIDPTFKSDKYKLELLMKLERYKTINDDLMIGLTQSKLDNFNDLTNGSNINQNNLEIIIMINKKKDYDYDENKIKFYEELINKIGNNRSKVIVYNDLSHMIHYKRSAEIIQILKNMLKN